MNDDAYDYALAADGTHLVQGQLVMVMRAVPTNDRGWKNSWEPEMDKQIGKIHRLIFDPSRNGAEFGISCSFPCHVLMPITEGPVSKTSWNKL